MKKIESFSIDDTKKSVKEDKEDKDNLINRYEVDNYNLQESFLLRQKKKKKLPLLFYVFIFAILFLLSLVISIIYEYVIKKKNYTVVEEPYLKPSISHYNYTKVKFNNHLELLLIQVDEDDEAGGAIVFDTGYLDTNYKPGFLKLAFLSLLTDDIQNNIKLLDYLGELNYKIEEHYSYFYFKIVNAGFFSYLEIFSKLTHLDSDDERYNKIKDKESQLKKTVNTLEKKEKHLLEYLIYGYKDDSKNEEDIYPEGNNISNLTETDVEEIKSIMKNLLNPTKMKIVLNSHFKMSLMKNKFIKYFQNIIHKNDENIDIKPAYSISDFTTNKLIYMQIEDHQTNYIKINYYITSSDKYEDLIKNSGYFNYLKYILDETNPESLYYNLTNSENYNIKSLSCDFEVILKSKIRFSIKIDLNSYSYEYLQDIVLVVYEYVDKLIEFINKLSDKDERTLELFTIMKQTFSFTEDLHDISEDNGKKGINLFSKKDSVYFLRDEWLPGNYSTSHLKEFASQLKRENSVLIVGINDETFYGYNTIFNNSIFKDMFQNKSYNGIYRFNYAINDLSKIFENKTLILKDNINFTYYNNNYISIYDDNSKLDYDPKDINNYKDQASEEIGNYHNIRVTYFKRDTSFRIPKVFITVNFFHPYMRPQGDENFKNERFFEVMLYMAYIQREINLKLADAIRAKNTFYISFNQNLFYISIFAYSDVAKLILDNIKDIALNKSAFSSNENIFLKNYKIYKEASLEDFLDFTAVSEDTKIRMAFYENLFIENENVGIYNYYKFPSDDYKKNNSKKEYNEFIHHLYLSAINLHLYGYLDINEAKDINNIFNMTESDYQEFNNSLVLVSISKINVNAENFTKWMNNKNNLKENKELNYKCTQNNIQKYRFLHWSGYDSENRVISYLFNKMLNEGIKKDEKSKITQSINFSQREIYLQFNMKEELGSDDKFIEYISTLFNLKKNEYNEKVDVVGDRLYYLIRNYVAELDSTHEDMRHSAITRMNSNTNNMEDFSKLEGMKDMKYSNFLDSFKKIYKKEFHIDFKCSNNNNP